VQHAEEMKIKGFTIAECMHVEELKQNNKSAGYYTLMVRTLENSICLTSTHIRTKASAKERARCLLDADSVACNGTSISRIINRPRQLSNFYPTSSYCSTKHQLFKVSKRSNSIDLLPLSISNAFLNLIPSVFSLLQAL
jgi:hypothetical protein